MQLKRQSSPGTPALSVLQWRSRAVALAGYAFVVRLLYAAQVELMPEEAYYWNYSRHLDIGYLDHPPMVAWLIRIGTTFFGNTEFGVRFGALCCGVAASYFIYRLTRNVFGEACALVALILAQLLPFFFLSGVLMTPDAPLTAAWAASLYFLERALVAGRASAWLFAGLAMGIGLLSKYTIGLLGIAALLHVLLDPDSRRWLRRWQPYAGILIAVFLFAPVVLWNAQHEWVSFTFQTSRRLAERPRFSLHKLIAAAMVLITPTGLLAVVAAFVRGKPQSAVLSAPTTLTAPATMARSWRLLQLALIVPLAVFFVFSLRHEVKLDWTGAPWVAALPVLGFGIVESVGKYASKWSDWLRFAWPPTLIALMFIYAAGWCYLVPGIPGVPYSHHNELIPVGWGEFGREIEALADDVRNRSGERVLVVGMDRYAIASELAFYSRDQARSVAGTSAGHLFDQMGLMYERWFPADLQAGRTLLLVAWDAESLAAARLEGHVSGLEPLREGVLIRNGKVVRHYYHRVAHGYRSAPVAHAGIIGVQSGKGHAQ